MNPQDYGTAGATSPAKQKFIASAASRAYKGPSVVDYLSLSGYDTSPASRTALAKDYGISDYSVNAGNASQNDEFLRRLRGDTSTSTTGATTPGAAVTPGNTATVDPYKAAYDKYISTLTVSPEERQAKEYLNKLITQSASDNEKALNSGETLGFATGEAARVNRSNQLGIDAASRALDTFTGYRTADSAAAKARLDFEKGLRDENKPFELSEGQSRYDYDPTTGTYKEVASKGNTYAPKTTSTTTETNKNIEADVEDAVKQFQEIMKLKGWKGVNPDDYNEIAN